MGQATVSISLHDGIACKTFAAEVTGRLGQPLKGVEVTFSLNGDGSLAPDHVSQHLRAATDALGRVAVALNRPEGHEGDIGAELHAECPIDEGDIHMRFLGMTTERDRPSR